MAVESDMLNYLEENNLTLRKQPEGWCVVRVQEKLPHERCIGSGPTIRTALFEAMKTEDQK